MFTHTLAMLACPVFWSETHSLIICTHIHDIPCSICSFHIMSKQKLGDKLIPYTNIKECIIIILYTTYYPIA